MLSQYQLGVLTGILESRGSYYISKHGNYYRPVIQISSQHISIINNISQILKLPIKYWIDKRDNRRLYYYITISGLHDLKNITEELRDYLVYKKYQNDLMHEFCVSRLSHYPRRYWKGKHYPYKVPYTPRELEIINILRSLTNINKSRRGI